MPSMRVNRQKSSKILRSLFTDESKSSKYNVEGRRTALSFPLQTSVSSAQKNVDSGDDEDNCGLSIEQILALKEQFDAADIDGGGSLDLNEFMEAFGSVIQSSGKKLEDEQIERLFMQIDANSDGGIDWGEFSDYMLMESQANQTEIAEKVASFYLLDGTGSSHEVEWHQAPVTCICLDPVGGGCITASKDQQIHVWSPSLNLSKTIRSTEKGSIFAMCTLPHTGKLCTSAVDRIIRIYDLHTWELQKKISLANVATCMCTWQHGENEILAYGDDKGQITIVNTSQGFVRAREDEPLDSQWAKWANSVRKKVHQGWVHDIHMVEELGGIMSCGDESAVLIYEYPLRDHPDRAYHKYDVVPKRTLRSHRGHSKGVRCLAWVSSQKVIASGGLERIIIIWNPYTGNQIAQLVGHQIGVEKLLYNAEYDQVISLSSDRVLKVWDMVHSECIQSITSEHTRPATMAYDQTRKRLITCSRRPYSWRVNPRILLPSSETTHRSEIVAVLLNRVFGQLVTVAEDTETCVWRVGTGKKIFSYFDTEKEEDAPLSCAAFDEAGRRLITGDHQGVVRIWNFNNGACLKILRKPPGADRRQEVTAISCYELEEKRFIAASGWDCRITVWVDSSEASCEPFLQIDSHTNDIVCMAFIYPKNLITCSLDGSVLVFDMESGARRLAFNYHQSDKQVHGPKPTASPYFTALETSARSAAKSSGSTTSDFSKSENVERMCVLIVKNRTIVTVGSDGNISFWDGITFRLTIAIPARQAEVFGLVDVQTDKSNSFLVTGDQGGFIKIWDIKEYRASNPRESQVKLVCFWQAHECAISALDIVPYPKKHGTAVALDSRSSFDYVVVTCSTDRKVLVWSSSAVLIGQLGQGREWTLDNLTTWESRKSLNSLSYSKSIDAPEPKKTDVEFDDLDFSKPDEKSAPKKILRLRSAKLQAIPESGKKYKKKDYSLDSSIGERIPEKKQGTKDEKQRAMSPYLKSFVKKIDPENVVADGSSHMQISGAAAGTT